jgi:predicted acetyltransferase
MPHTLRMKSGEVDRGGSGSPFRFATPRDDSELDQLMTALKPIFDFPEGLAERYAQTVGRENFRILWRADELIGGLAFVPMGQFFGGRSVPMTGVAVVGIRPEFRGGGTGTALMIEAVRELNAKGIALSTLYPATVPLYRRAGYESAGSRFEIKLALRQLEVGDRQHEIQRITEDDQAIVESLYNAFAPRRSGFLDRNHMMWKRVTAPRGQIAQGFLAIDPQTRKAEGYVYYVQKSSDEAQYMLVCSDFVALTPAAGRRLLTFLQDHRTMADAALLNGGSTDHALSLLPERTYKVKMLDHWMLRIVDVGAALSARGYPRGYTGEIHLDVIDDQLIANNGRYVVEIDNGRGQVSAGGDGTLNINVRGLAALYSGFKSPTDLIALDLLKVNAGKSADAIDLAAAAFAGSESCMSDAF